MPTAEVCMKLLEETLVEDRFTNPNRVEARQLARLGAQELAAAGGCLTDLLRSAAAVNDTCRTWFAK